MKQRHLLRESNDLPPVAAVPAPKRTALSGERLNGAAVRPDQLLGISPMEAVVRRDCGLLVPEFHGQWSAIEWIRGEPYYGNYDAIVDYAQATGKQVRGHALIWEQMAPDWANAKDSARRGAMLRLVENLKARGIPLDSVGLQGHIELAKGPIAQKEVETFIAQLAATGVEVAITELDVLEKDRSIPVERRDLRIAEATERLLEVACANPAVTSITTWGLSDRDSWLQDRGSQTRLAHQCSGADCVTINRGLPYDGQMRPKPMRQVIERFVC